MALDRATLALRAAYWTAAVADFVVAVLVLIPSRMGVREYVYPMGLMSAVALSWGVMLLVADRRPWERRWMLAPTLLVVALLGVAQVHAGVSELLVTRRVVVSVVATVVVFVVVAIGLWVSRGDRPQGSTEGSSQKR